MNRRFHRAVLAGIAMLAVSCEEPTAPEQSQVSAALAANEGVTPIDACGTVISAPGKYRLTTDLINCSAADANWAIAIRASDVILRLDGHRIASYDAGAGTVETCIQATGDRIRIIGPGVIGWCSHGLMLEGVTNSSVSHLQVQGDHGIVLDNVSGIALEHLSMVDNVDFAIAQLGPVSNLVLRHSIIRRSRFEIGSGFHLSGTRIAIEHNVFERLFHAVVLTGDSNLVADNRVTDNFLGIWVRGAGNRVLRNDVTGVLFVNAGGIRTGLGISVDGTGNEILRNVLSGVAVEGISVSGSGNLISGNRLFGNPGIDLMDLNGVCGVNIWEKNRADTRSPACLK